MKYILKGLFYGFIASIMFYTCGLLDVHAAVYNPIFIISNNNATSGNKVFSNGTYTDYDIDYQGYPEELSDPSDKWLTSLVLCVSKPQTNPTISNSNNGSISELSVNNSNLKCYLDNTNQGNISIINWKSAGGGSYNHVKFTANQSSDTYISVIDFSIDLEFYKTPQDYTNISSIIDQQLIYEQSLANTTNTINNDNYNTNQIIQNEYQNSQLEINHGITNSQNEINAANQNTDRQIDSQKVCKVYDSNNVIKKGYYINSNGGESSTSNSFGISDYINIKGGSITVINKLTSGTSMCFYNNLKVVISCITNSSTNNNESLTIPNDAFYFRYTADYSLNIPRFSICQNGNQATNDAINDLNNTISDSGVDNPSSDFSSFGNMIATNGTITNLVTLPITLFTNILNSINGTCTNFNLGNLFGTDLVIPCIQLSNYLGSTLWGVIDILFSGFLVYKISRKFIQVFHDLTSMKEGDDLA